MRRISATKHKDLVIGSTVEATVIKNSLGAAYSVAEFSIHDTDSLDDKQIKLSRTSMDNLHRGRSYMPELVAAATILGIGRSNEYQYWR